MSKKNQHVVPHDDDWAVKGAGNSKATSVHSTQGEAIERAREIVITAPCIFMKVYKESILDNNALNIAA
jgi:hypothetical protein